MRTSPPVPRPRGRISRSLDLVACGLLACLAACASIGTGEWNRVQSTVWHLVSLEGELALENVEVTLELRAGLQLFGHAGVNRYFGTYTRDDTKFDAPRIASERKAGPPDRQRQEARYLKLLDRANTVRLDGDALVLSDETGELLRFVPGP